MTLSILSQKKISLRVIQHLKYTKACVRTIILSASVCHVDKHHFSLQRKRYDDFKCIHFFLSSLNFHVSACARKQLVEQQQKRERRDADILNYSCMLLHHSLSLASLLYVSFFHFTPRSPFYPSARRFFTHYSPSSSSNRAQG